MSPRTFAVTVALFGLTVAGPHRAPPGVAGSPARPATRAGGSTGGAGAAGSPQAGLRALTRQERSDAALWDALTLVASPKRPESLAALEKSGAHRDSEQMR